MLSIDVLTSNDAPFFKRDPISSSSSSSSSSSELRPLTRVILEDTSANQLDPMNVEELFGSLIADRDEGSEKGVAILGADNRNGQVGVTISQGIIFYLFRLD